MPSEKTYLGQIVDINDPLKQGRARVSVFGLFDDLAVENIPWAEQNSCLSFGANYGGGNITVPRLGAVVSVHFEEENYYKITYDYIKEQSHDIAAELQEENSYEGTQSLVYDGEALPGALKIIYTRKKGLVISLGDAKVQLDTQNGGELRIVVKMGEDEIRMEKKKVIVKCENIELGEGAIEKLVKGSTFLKYFNTHTHPTGVGPSGTPIVKMTDKQHLSQVSKTK
jgi:hypothetical protein